MVDHEYRFMNVYAGWPGSVHDARILSNCKLFAIGEAGTLVPNLVRTISGVPVPVVILGDPAYPLLTAPAPSHFLPSLLVALWILPFFFFFGWGASSSAGVPVFLEDE